MRAALVEQVRQQQGRLRGDQRMRAGDEPAPHRRLQRRRRDLLVERASSASARDRLRLPGLGAQPRARPRQHLLIGARARAVAGRGASAAAARPPAATTTQTTSAAAARLCHHGPARL